MYSYFKILIAIILFALAIIDFRKKEIPVWLIITLFITVIGYRGLTGFELIPLLTGLSVGGVILGISILSKEKIGIGDGLVAAALGIFLGGEKTIIAMLIASVIMTVVSVILLITKKGKMDTTLPFIPAVFLGFMLA